jgi:hypothetical protein
LRGIIAFPNPTFGYSLITLTARIDDLTTGFSDIIDAEYYVNTINGTGNPLPPSDGFFDSSNEEVKIDINVSSWTLGNHTLFVHGKDKTGLWGNFRNITIEVTESSSTYVSNIDMEFQSRRRFFWREYRVKTLVNVVDIEGNPLEDAIVRGTWSGDVSGEAFGTTDENGRAVLYSPWRIKFWRPLTFTFSINLDESGIEKAGYIYYPWLNVESSDTLII